MAIWNTSRLMRLDPSLPSSSAVAVVASTRGWKRENEKKAGWWLIPASCTPSLNPVTRQQTDDGAVLKEDEEGMGIMCEPCNGRGWLLCDFCKGQKTNVKAENNRVYRRCPDCRAVGYVLCSNCKVFKCVTYPDFSDGEL